MLGCAQLRALVLTDAHMGERRHTPHARHRDMGFAICFFDMGYDLLNITDMVDAEGAGVTSVSWMVLPSALRTKVFSRATLPSRV